MGFRRAIVISQPFKPEIRKSALSFARGTWPGIAFPPTNRRFGNRILFAAPELTDYLFDTDKEYENAVSQSYAIADGVAALSTKFNDVTFAYIDADCFGGTCLYSGFAMRNGTEIFSTRADRKGHKKLLRQIGFRMWYNHFSPFTRGYFSDA